jgi:hypothetical protein
MLVLVCALFLSACGSTDAEPASTDAPSAESCPEYSDYPGYVGFLDWYVDNKSAKEGHPTPEAAVRDVAGHEIEVREIRASEDWSEIDVRHGSHEGTFFVEHLGAGWLVEGGQGCAVMPASETVPDAVTGCPRPHKPASQREEDDGVMVVCSIEFVP